MTKKYSAIRGMSDIMPPESEIWQYIERTARDVFASFNCFEIRTPLVEKTDLFVRSIGEHNAVVEKEMYSFLDRNEESLTIRPEGTASVVRAFIENGRPSEGVSKYYYSGPMFRYERPQKGRKRQFHQIGLEIFGSENPAVDAEVMAISHQIFKSLGLSGYTLEINSIGCPECRPAYYEKLVKFLKKLTLCEDCVKRIDQNPMRVLDCKNADCQDALKNVPVITDQLCDTCDKHFSGVQENLKLLDVPFVINKKIVRGLDYYIRTAFEFTTDKLGSQNAICAGGRYDGLVKSMGGPEIPGVGFSIGFERMLLLLETLKKVPELGRELVFFTILGDEARKKVLPLISVLRADGINCDWDYEGRSMKSQMRTANKLNAHTVVIAGENEANAGIVQVKNMHTSEQVEVRLEDLPRHFVRVEV